MPYCSNVVLLWTSVTSSVQTVGSSSFAPERSRVKQSKHGDRCR